VVWIGSALSRLRHCRSATAGTCWPATGQLFDPLARSLRWWAHLPRPAVWILISSRSSLSLSSSSFHTLFCFSLWQVVASPGCVVRTAPVP